MSKAKIYAWVGGPPEQILARKLDKRLLKGGHDLQELLNEFKSKVHDRAKTIDPGEEHHWLGLTVGWAIAKGVEPKLANDFAIFVRYSTDLA